MFPNGFYTSADNDDPATYRGCKPKSIEVPEDKIEVCQNDFCNFELFPRNRLQCHQCEANCVKINEEVHKVKPCVNYEEADECYTIVLSTFS